MGNASYETEAGWFRRVPTNPSYPSDGAKQREIHPMERNAKIKTSGGRKTLGNTHVKVISPIPTSLLRPFKLKILTRYCKNLKFLSAKKFGRESLKSVRTSVRQRGN